MFKMDIWAFWSQLSSCCTFYIVPKYISNHHTKFEIDRTILAHFNYQIKKPQKGMLKMDILAFWRMIIEFFRF